MDKIILSNWTHRSDRAGGAETVFSYLKKVFPKAELASGVNLFETRDCPKMIKEMDRYLLERYKKDKNLLIIRDAEFGGMLDISMIPQIAIFGNPYIAINEKIQEDLGIKAEAYSPWMLNCHKKLKVTKKVATSNYMVNEMKKEGIKADAIIPNCVDLNIFKPLSNKEKLKERYEIPKNKRVGIWVGSDSQVKNFQMMLNLISCFQNMFWIMVTKERFSSPFQNLKIFYNINSEILNELHNCADFFILTSPIEGCGIAMLEAMSAGVPCILSKAGYFWDFWDDRIGIQINYDSFDEHAKAIYEIDKIKTDSRQVIIDQKLDFKHWKKRWEDLVNSLK